MVAKGQTRLKRHGTQLICNTGTVIFLAGLLGGQFGGGTEGLGKLQEAPISHALFAKNLAFLDAPAAGPGTLGEEEKADSA